MDTPDPREVAAVVCRWLSYLEPGEKFERIQLTGRTKSGRVTFHSVPVVPIDPDGLTPFQRRALQICADSPYPVKRDLIVRAYTNGRVKKAAGTYGKQLKELVERVTAPKLYAAEGHVTDDPSKFGKRGYGAEGPVT